MQAGRAVAGLAQEIYVREENTGNMISGSAIIPHPDKANRIYDLEPKLGGEDSYFINDSKQVVGIADGVGGWASRGVDPGIYSRELMNFANIAVDQEKLVDPLQILIKAHSQTTSLGSSTALVIHVDIDKNELTAANIGDSGFKVIRNFGNLILSSKPQQFDFNFPYQLERHGSRSGNNPTEADIIKANVKTGDFIICGTDGVFDNLFDKDLIGISKSFQSQFVNIVNRREGNSTDNDIMKKLKEMLNKFAFEIAKAASRNGNDPRYISPFTVEGRKYGYNYVGGKLDDISVIVTLYLGNGSNSTDVTNRSKL